jgi:hypothetical protein
MVEAPRNRVVDSGAARVVVERQRGVDRRRAWPAF